MDKISNDVKVYTDVQSLERLRYQSNKNPNEAKKEVAQQFEAMLMQIVLRSMREANKAISSDLFGSDQMDFYQDIFDKQLSLLTSNSSTGFAHIVETNIDQQYGLAQNSASAIPETKPNHELKNEAENIKPLFQLHKDTSVANSTVISKYEKAPPQPHKESIFNSPEEFVKTLWTSAKTAAKAIGVDPKLLLAQAALETNWGKKILPHGKENSSFNLFNIKADHSWKNQTTTMDTLEQKDGVLSKVKSSFRSYESFVDSFKDYVQFLKQNGRYNDALKKANDPHQFIHALQSAGYATDTNYADKIMKIFSSNNFKSLTGKLE